MGFQVELTNAGRDRSQGQLGNRASIHSDENKQNNQTWNKLVVDSRDRDSAVKFGVIETGGADPQVQEVFLNEDYTELNRLIAQDAPDTGQRPLMRGTNGHGLAPNSPLEIKALAKENIRNSGGVQRNKVFDSQGDFDKVKSTLEGSKETIDEGYDAEVDIAIPYASGRAGANLRDPEYAELDPYPVEFYLQKVREAIQVAKESGIDESKVIISFKAMVGDMDAKTSAELARAVIKELKDTGSKARYGLHLHDTGLSKEACVAAIEVAKQEDWPIVVDTVEGDDDTGFVSPLELDEALQAKGIDLGLTGEDRTRLKVIGKNNDKIAADYDVVRTSGALSGEDKRNYGMPSGGEKAFETAVLTGTFDFNDAPEGEKPTKKTLAEKLNISEGEALHVAGMGLIATRQLIGWSFGVTPGFAMTQDAGIHLLKNMAEANYLTSDMSFDDMKAKTVKKLSDDQIREFFLKDLPQKPGNFIANNKMPAEYGMVDSKLAPRSVIRKAYPFDGGKTPSDTQYYEKVAEAEKLLAEGLLKPTVTQTGNILQRMQKEGLIASDDARKTILSELENGNVIHAQPDGQESDWFADAAKAIDALKAEGLIADGAEGVLFDRLHDHARHSGTCRQIVLGNDANLRDRLKHQWVGEPLATQFKNNNPEYTRGIARYKQGLNAQLDRDGAEILRQHLWAGNVDVDTAYGLADKMIEQEWEEIRASVLDYMEENPGRVISAIEGVSKNGSAGRVNIIRKIKEEQEQIFAEHLAQTGVEFFYTLEQRQSIAAGFLGQQIDRLANEITNDAMHDIVKRLENPEFPLQVLSPMPALVSKVYVEKGQTVKEGDDIAMVEAMKMEHHLKASHDGVIENIDVQVGDSVENKQALVSYEFKEPPPNAIEVHITALRDANQAAIANVKTYLDENAPKEVIGYSLPTNENVRQPQPDNLYVELVINRAGCNAKIAGDLQAAGLDTIMLYVDSDKETPVIQAQAEDAKHQIRDYMDQEEMVATIKAVLAKNEGKTVRIHPGWGFLSEKHEFVARLEEEFKDGSVIFVGPNSKAMDLAGDKRKLREEVEVVASQYNPRFFENTGTIEELRDYVASDFSEDHALHAKYHSDFNDNIMGQRMRGDVIIKAVAGGGGKGIEEFKHDGGGDEENYQRYVSTVLQNREYAHKHYGNSQMLTERFIRGNAHHVEVQFAATHGNSTMLGYRDCTLQQGGQKIAEMNIIEGDYTPEMIAKIREAGELITQHLAEKGYEGVGTLEMLVLPETKEVMVLEVNTRLQVEHGVTEGDIKLKTGKSLSLPLLNAHLMTNAEGKRPEQIVEDVFGLNADEREALLVPGTERYGQYRLTAKDHDLEGGEQVKPTGYKDTMWPASIAQHFRDKHGVEIIHGGIGSGAFDSQFGAILGNKEQFEKAIPELIKFFRLSGLFDREAGPISGFNNARDLVLKVLLTEDGQINPETSVNRVGNIIDDVNQGKIKPVTPANLNEEAHWPDERNVHLARTL